MNDPTKVKVEVVGCSRHNFRAIIIDDKRVTEAKCCGSWDELLMTWETSPAWIIEAIEDHITAAAPAPLSAPAGTRKLSEKQFHKFATLEDQHSPNVGRPPGAIDVKADLITRNAAIGCAIAAANFDPSAKPCIDTHLIPELLQLRGTTSSPRTPRKHYQKAVTEPGDTPAKSAASPGSPRRWQKDETVKAMIQAVYHSEGFDHDLEKTLDALCNAVAACGAPGPDADDAQEEALLRAHEESERITAADLSKRLHTPGAGAVRVSEEVTALLHDLTDADECQFDHHGHCQAHGWLTAGECPHARAKRLTAALRSSGVPTAAGGDAESEEGK